MSIEQRNAAGAAQCACEAALRFVGRVLDRFVAGGASGQTATNTPSRSRRSLSPVTFQAICCSCLRSEYPTLDSMANLGNYDPTRAYTGYFDPGKCYKYSYSATETKPLFLSGRHDHDACLWPGARSSGAATIWTESTT